jgi:hypothetical protein
MPHGGLPVKAGRRSRKTISSQGLSRRPDQAAGTGAHNADFGKSLEAISQGVEAPKSSSVGQVRQRLCGDSV